MPLAATPNRHEDRCGPVRGRRGVADTLRCAPARRCKACGGAPPSRKDKDSWRPPTGTLRDRGSACAPERCWRYLPPVAIAATPEQDGGILEARQETVRHGARG